MASNYPYIDIKTSPMTMEQINSIFKDIDFTKTPDLVYDPKLFNDWAIDLKPGEEEWIWVKGYKATDKNMKCRDYQFELGKQHDMPADEPIAMCSSGFHFCDKLNKTYKYYNIQDGNRYFEVKALVRRWKKDGYYVTEQRDDKMVAKSIILTRELTIDEIFDVFRDTDTKTWTTEQKEMARQTSVSTVRESIKIAKMVELGYSEAFSTYVVNISQYAYDFACTMANTPGVSMDVKVLSICMRMFK